MDPSERFRNRANAWFHLTMILAAVVGGFWALIEYRQLLKAETALADLAKLRLEVEGRPSLRLELEVEQLTGRGGPETVPRQLAITLRAENSGTKETVMILPRPTQLRVTRVDAVGPGGKIVPGAVSKGRTAYFAPADPDSRTAAAPDREIEERATLVPPAGGVELSFLVEVPGPGTYHANFVARPASLGPDGQPLEEQVPEDPLHGTWWRATRYFVVE